MALLVRTTNSSRLLERIHELVSEGRIAWEWADGRLTLRDEQWNCAAGFAIKVMDSAILFSIVPPEEDLVGQRTYALFHARLLDDLVTECSARMETIHVTARPAGIDKIDGRETANSVSA